MLLNLDNFRRQYIGSSDKKTTHIDKNVTFSRQRVGVLANVGLCFGLSLFCGKALGDLGVKTVSANYHIDVELSYYDRISLVTGFPRVFKVETWQPNFIQGSQLNLESTNSNRAFGLNKSEFIFDFHVFNGSRFQFALRPDIYRSESAAPTSLDYDTRAGVVREQVPNLRLLDHYILGVERGAGFAANFGVFPHLVEPSRTMPILMSGIRVEFPKKYSGIELTWRSAAAGGAIDLTGSNKGWRFALVSLEGDNDRTDAWEYSGESYDYGPSSSDSYRGGGFKASFEGQSLYSFMLLQMSEAVFLGRTSQTGARLGIDFEPAETRFGILLSTLDIRHSEERGVRTMGQFPTLLQQSVSLRSSLEVQLGHRLEAGFIIGRSALPSTEVIGQKILADGWQVDLGYRRRVGHNIDLKIAISGEQRLASFAGQPVGGFDFVENGENYMNRILLGIDYLAFGSL
jgi:hypothetical protein